jgi:hypothetical protein
MQKDHSTLSSQLAGATDSGESSVDTEKKA